METDEVYRRKFVLINNIPSEYHSSDLRNFYSQFIESGGFECFHYRHRPETKSAPNNVEIGEDRKTLDERPSCCCVVRLKDDKMTQFLNMYNRKHWIDKSGGIMSQVCYISKVKIPVEQDGDCQWKTRAEQKQIPPNREGFTLSDLNSLPELNPPDLMPNGNVGTPTLVFMDFIKQCRLPPKVIKKLGLSFPRTRTSKQYGNVHFDYGGEVTVSEENNSGDDKVLTGSGHEIIAEEDVTSTKNCDNSNVINSSVPSSSSDFISKSNRMKKKTWRDKEAKERMSLNIEEKLIGQKDESEEDNDSCEEWERHEALYDDPSNQERNKERLFEEEIELKWEKGGSGLVFYTDAQYWQAQEGDFDEQTADDWDVDMSGYYEKGAGDKDARDFLTMRQEKRRREGIEATDRFTAGIAIKKKKSEKKKVEKSSDKIGQFEAHTKGIGRKILEDQGWSEGQGLGSSVTGISDALDNEGQKPKDKRGFGYHGEKLNRTPSVAHRKVIISTIYDDPKVTDPHEELTRRNEPYHIKYRDEVKFTKSETLFSNDEKT
ncbi:G patch domain-containing protein 3 [Mactra antiquata]